jgi:hypothetical protein
MAIYEIDGEFFDDQKAYREALSESMYENAYQPWSIKEDEDLLRLVSLITVNELSMHFKRKPGAIRSRLKKLSKKQLKGIG